MSISLKEWSEKLRPVLDEQLISHEIGKDFNIFDINKIVKVYKDQSNILHDNLKRKSKVFIFGAGGTTSWFLPKLLKIYNDAFHKAPLLAYELDIILMDMDVIEPKNLIRQNFISHDIGRNKAEVLSERYSDLYPNISVKFVPKFATYTAYDKIFLKDKEFDPEYFTDIATLGITEKDIIINLVDNEGFKKKLDHLIINQALTNTKYFAAGVNLFNGQVYYSNNFKTNSYTLDHLDLFDDFEEVSVNTCADVDANGTADNPDQLFNGNDLAASLLANIFQSALTDIPLYKKVNFISGNNINVTKGAINYSNLFKLTSYIHYNSEYCDYYHMAKSYLTKYGPEGKTQKAKEYYEFLKTHDLVGKFVDKYKALARTAIINPIALTEEAQASA